MQSQADRPKGGLRQRKKAKTRAAIQHHALRLFREHGYGETTVEQIAEAAEVSESTFFRYFPTKEDVVLWDQFDPLLIAAFRSQPLELSPIQAVRAAFRQVLGQVPAQEMEEQRERMDLMLSVPQLRSAVGDQFLDMLPVVSELVTQLVVERAGRVPDDLAVRTMAGAVIGVAFSVMLTAAEDPGSDWVALVDAGFAHLEAGLPL